jgi:sulfoxide reductase catalytic subunit YedY
VALTMEWSCDRANGDVHPIDPPHYRRLCAAVDGSRRRAGTTVHLILASLEFPLWLRLSHYINLLFLGLLIRSGIQILGAHPRLYWNEGCTPRSEWLKFTKREVPLDGAVVYTSLDDEVDVPAWLGLPAGKNLGLGRHWHGVSTACWLLNGLIYVALLLTTGEWARLFPTSWTIFPGAWHALTEYLTFHIPPASEFHPTIRCNN